MAATVPATTIPSITIMGTARDHASRSLLWSSVDTFSQTGFSILALVLLARLLPVEEIGIGTFAIMIAQLTGMPFELWFHDALVQRKELKPQHISTAFTMTLLAAAGAAMLLSTVAPWLAAYSGKPRVTTLIRVASLAIPVSAMSAVLSAILRRELNFVPLARRTVIGRVAGLIIGVITAWMGAGAWALVIMYVSSIVFSTLSLLITYSGTPLLRYNKAALRDLLHFAAPNMLAQLLLLANGRLFVVLSGFFINAQQLGCLSLAFRIVEELRNTLSSAAAQVALPLLSKRTQQPQAFMTVLKEATCFTSSILLPLYAGMAATAGDLMTSVFGIKWLDAASTVRILALAAAIVTLRQYSSVALNAMGKPAMNIKINGIAFACSVVLLYSGLTTSADAMAEVWLLRGGLLLVVSIVGMRWATGLSANAQLIPNFPAVIAAAAMYLGVMLLSHALPATQSAAVRLAISSVIGAMIYLCTLSIIAPQLPGKLMSFVQAAVMRRNYGAH